MNSCLSKSGGRVPTRCNIECQRAHNLSTFHVAISFSSTFITTRILQVAKTGARNSPPSSPPPAPHQVAHRSHQAIFLSSKLGSKRITHPEKSRVEIGVVCDPGSSAHPDLAWFRITQDPQYGSYIHLCKMIIDLTFRISKFYVCNLFNLAALWC